MRYPHRLAVIALAATLAGAGCSKADTSTQPANATNGPRSTAGPAQPAGTTAGSGTGTTPGTQIMSGCPDTSEITAHNRSGDKATFNPKAAYVDILDTGDSPTSSATILIANYDIPETTARGVYSPRATEMEPDGFAVSANLTALTSPFPIGTYAPPAAETLTTGTSGPFATSSQKLQLSNFSLYSRAGRDLLFNKPVVVITEVTRNSVCGKIDWPPGSNAETVSGRFKAKRI